MSAPIFANYGDGFATDPSLVAGLSDPSAFFKTLLNKEYLNQVVIAPHVSPVAHHMIIHSSHSDTSTAVAPQTVNCGC